MNITQSYFQSIKNGNVSKVKELLENNHILVNHSNIYKFTGLHYASIYNQEDIVELLIERGADIQQVNLKGMSAAHLAAYNGHLKLYHKLLSHGCNPFLKNIQNELSHEVAKEHYDFEQYIKLSNNYLKTYKNNVDTSLPSKVIIPEMKQGNSFILCSGIGCQKMGMINEYIESETVKHLFEEASDILGYDIVQIINTGPNMKLKELSTSQCAIYLTNLACILYENQNNQQKINHVGHISGFSFGELTALVIAGVIDWRTGLLVLNIIMKEIENLSKKHKYKMILISGLGDEIIEDICKTTSTHIVNNLSKKTRVISGKDENIFQFKAEVIKHKPKICKMIPINLPIHSTESNIIKTKLESTLDRIEIKRPKISIYSNILAKQVKTGRDVKKILSNILTSSVNFEGLFKNLDETGKLELFDNIYELPPSSQMTPIIKSLDKRSFKKITQFD
tara:strand:+ start:13138 stop:14490 length:1353 start_codon:yes stop_codon:yes gene_type:complete